MDQATILHHTFVIDRRYAHPPEKVFSGFAGWAATRTAGRSRGST
jgi:uncharacterized protein YndB with AHSA1/START domain